jgi:hypothetical protein
MTRLARLCRALGVGLAVAAATLSTTQLAYADLAPPTLPADSPLVAPSGSQLFLIGHAKGVQIYTCNGNGDWGKSVPRADLVDDAGNLVVKHSAGPEWAATGDTSAVLGHPEKNVPSPAAGPAIPWLLLSTTDASPAGSPPGLLTGTKFIQRLETKGGTAPPAAECKTQTAGKVKEVPYQADYYFWR